MLDFTPKSTAEMVFANADTQSILNDILLGNISFPSNGKNSLLLYGVFGSVKLHTQTSSLMSTKSRFKTKTQRLLIRMVI